MQLGNLELAHYGCSLTGPLRSQARTSDVRISYLRLETAFSGCWQIAAEEVPTGGLESFYRKFFLERTFERIWKASCLSTFSLERLRNLGNWSPSADCSILVSFLADNKGEPLTDSSRPLRIWEFKNFQQLLQTNL